MFYLPSGLFSQAPPVVQWATAFAVVAAIVGGFVYGITRPLPPDFYREGRNNWISECTGNSRAIDDCAKTWDGSRTLQSLYIEKATLERGSR